MFSNKTGHLALEVATLRDYGQKRVLLCKPTTDTRSGVSRIKPRGGQELEAFEIPSEDPAKIISVLRETESRIGGRVHVVAIDEAQFFPYEAHSPENRLYNVVRELLERGYDVIAAGLPLDFRGEPFGSVPALVMLARDNVTWLDSYCSKCGRKAVFPQRLSGDQRLPVPYAADQILVGDTEAYEPRCADDFILPGKPVFP